MPHTPVMRFAAPVLLGEQAEGVVSLTLVGDAILDPIRSYGSEQHGREVLVGQLGFYKAHHERDKEWGGRLDLRTGESLMRDYGEATASDILSGESGRLEIGPNVGYYQPIFPDPGNPKRYWVLLRTMPRTVVVAPVRRMRL
ncbi:MAG: hypothetical protein GTN78_17460, partial [Gemmatimonadales bacterium]|nr:hypothetical protein [Gemmatimonadales bacterium]